MQILPFPVVLDWEVSFCTGTKAVFIHSKLDELRLFYEPGKISLFVSRHSHKRYSTCIITPKSRTQSHLCGFERPALLSLAIFCTPVKMNGNLKREASNLSSTHIYSHVRPTLSFNIAGNIIEGWRSILSSETAGNLSSVIFISFWVDLLSFWNNLVRILIISAC